MGDFIKFFEKKYYRDSKINGFFLLFSLILIIFIISYSLSLLPFFIKALIASTLIASKMLKKSVEDIIFHPLKINYLVSRDTKDLSRSDINKASIESYSENLSDGVIAPMFYLYLFDLPGIFIYKAINTLDSMVGYKTKKYKNFGYFSAKADDIANFIPARITALLIILIFLSKNSLISTLKYGNKHESPNAGYPISAMAGALNIALGGPTKYFGEIKNKPFFGDGRKKILTKDIKKALMFHNKFDFILFFILLLILF